MSDHEWLRMACEKARQGIAAGQSPFGAVVVSSGKLVAAAHNTVWKDTDPTAHAEVNAIRQAALALKRIELSGCEMFTTCEPCPMCLSAIHWSKLDRVVFAATIEDAAVAGFSELRVGAKELAKMGGSPLRVEVAESREEGRALFEEWHKAGGRSY